jgi:hypothetical protein
VRHLVLLLAVALTLIGVACASEEGSPPPSPDAIGPTLAPGEGTRAEGWDPPATVLGERVYVPIYSHIFFRDSRRSIDLAATLSIRNADIETPVQITSVRYYDSDGVLVRRYLDAPRTVGPMASTAFLVGPDDTGGVGANFIVDWRAERAVTPPVIEAVMIGAASSQGISFVTSGRVLQRAAAPLSSPPLSTEPAEPAAP